MKTKTLKAAFFFLLSLAASAGERLDPGLKQIGRLAVCEAKDVKSSRWGVRWRTADDNWDDLKAVLPSLCAKRVQICFRGDFSHIDAPVRDMAAMGVKPIIRLIWHDGEFDEWLARVTECVRRHGDFVDEWMVECCPDMFYRMAKAIRAAQPSAKIYCDRDNCLEAYRRVLEKLKKENALDLGSYFVYWGQSVNPDKSYAEAAEPLRRLVKSYSGAFDVMQGWRWHSENDRAWDSDEEGQCVRAKRLMRLAVCDATRAIPGVFGLASGRELCPTGAIHNAMKNVFSFLTDAAHPEEHHENMPVEVMKRFSPNDKTERRMSVVRFSRYGEPIRFYWFSESRPSDMKGFDRVKMWIPGNLKNLVWVEMISGRVFEIPESKIVRDKEKKRIWLVDMPMWDSPIMIAQRKSVPLDYDWKNAAPYMIADSIYRPGQFGHWMKALPPDGTEPWMKMKTEDFLPCFDRYGQFRWRDWPGKTKDDADMKRAKEAEEKDLAAHPGPKTWDKFGGWAAGPQLEATGRFRTEKVNGKWWFVDPEGHLFWSFGVMRASASCAMTPMNGDMGKPHCGYPMPDRDCLFTELPPPYGAPDATPFSKFWTTHDELLLPYFTARNETRIYDFSSANLYRKYGEGYYEKFTDLVHRRMRSWGMNTLSSSSDIAICLKDRTPYVERIERDSRPIAASYGEWFQFPDPWDPSFKAGILKELEKRKAQANDVWCIGFFVDNEINWGNTPSKLAEWTLQSPADQPAKRALVDFMRGKYGDLAKLNVAWGVKYADWNDLRHSTCLPPRGARGDLEAFTKEIEDAYFRNTRDAVKEFNPQLMYLGCRFSITPRPNLKAAAAKCCDVISHNFYAATPRFLGEIYRDVDRPVLIPEFHFGSNDRGNFGTGVRAAKNQADRAAKTKEYMRVALAMPNIVGAHWHQFSDQASSGRFDGENLTVGLTDICDRPYPEIVDAMREIGSRMYEVRDRHE